MIEGEVFNIPVRFICTADMGWVIPVADISKALGINKDTQSKILSRGKNEFSEFSTVVYVTSTTSKSGKVKLKCLTRDGMTMYLMKITPSRMEDPTVGEKVSDFQRYVIKTFGKHLDYYKVPQWWARREATKLKYKGMTDAIKDHLLYDVPDEMKWLVYATEADMLNVVIFGKTAKEAGCNQRDTASQSQLDLLEKLEEQNDGFIRLKFGIQIRYEMLCKIRDDLIVRGRSLAEIPDRTPDYHQYYTKLRITDKSV
ncbi:MAG: phage antirepressor N-terminal domain-containing protein [Dehalococcoidales bacterium]|jgi:hypothetical protein